MTPEIDVVVRQVQERLRRRTDPGVALVGVDGPSGSGKSTLAVPLAAALGAPLIRIDDFVTWHDFGAWWPRFDAEVLAPLLAGRDARHRVRDWQGDEFGDALAGWRTTPWAPVVVLEGVTCTRRAIADRLACRVWIEADPVERLRRGLARDGESHRALWTDWMREETAFFAADGTPDRADIRVIGDAPGGGF